MADGSDAPLWRIFGNITKLTRSLHDIRYNAVDDEIVVEVSNGDAILTFRGGGNDLEARSRFESGPFSWTPCLFDSLMRDP